VNDGAIRFTQGDQWLCLDYDTSSSVRTAKSRCCWLHQWVRKQQVLNCYLL